MKIVFTCIVLVALTLPLYAESQTEALTRLGVKITETGGKITQVNVDATNFTEADFKVLAACTDLKKLSIRGKTVNDTTLPLLAPLEQLEEISSDGVQLSDDGFKHFAPFKNLRSLALFHPSWDFKAFTGAGLAHLKDLPKLERLTFAGSTADDAALEAIAQITQLKQFSTWHTAQTQAGNTHLTKLNLTSIRMGQRLPKGGTPSPASFDASTITTFLQIKSLEKIDFMEARFTADELKPLKDLPNLKQISMSQVDISAADLEALKAALPNVKIDYKPLSDADREMLQKKLKL